MNSERVRDPILGGIPDALAVVQRLHDDYWGLVRKVEECINAERYEHADLILSTLGGTFRDAYHFRQQTARLMAARGQWPQLAKMCGDLLALNPQDDQNIGLMIVALTELRDLGAALDLVASSPPDRLSATWALERLFIALGHQDKTGLDLAPAIRNAALHDGRGTLWSAHAYRLAGEYATAEKLLVPLLRSRQTRAAARLELGLTRLQMPDWHRYTLDYEALLSDPDTAEQAAERFRRAVRLKTMLEAAYARGMRGNADFHVPDSFLEMVFEQTCNPLYAPVAGRVALVGATMAAGGAERVLGNAFDGLRESRNFDAELWLYSRNPAMQHDFFLKEMELDKRHAGSCFDLPYETISESFSYLPAGTSQNAQAVHAMIAARRPAVLHAWQDTTNLEAAFAGVLAGVPKIVLHPHNMRPELIHKAPVIGSLRRSYRALLGRDDVHIVFVSEASRRDYLDWLGHDGHERCHVIYNGFDCPAELMPKAQRARRAAVRRELGIPEQATVVGGVFRFHKLKRPKLWLDVAAAALRRERGLVFTIFGDGSEFDAAREHARHLGIADKVVFPGKVKSADEKVVAFDVLLHTSETEGLPTVIIEAQVAGVPVVAFGTGGVSECVHPALSHICSGDSVKEMSEALLAMLGKQHKGHAIRTAARTLRARFSREAMISHFERIYAA